MASEAPQSPWLDAWTDRLASIQTTSANLRFVDVKGNGDSRMLVGHMNSNRLKAFQGTKLEADIALPDTPSAIGECTPNSSGSGTSSPVVAVASGSMVFLYRELRPYGKFMVPHDELAPAELAAWKSLQTREHDVVATASALTAARDEGVQLSSRAHEFLGIEDTAAQVSFTRSFRDSLVVQEASVTCMETLTASRTSSCLVLGTENGRILILDSAGTTLLSTVQLPATPVALGCAGEFFVEFSLFVAARDGKVYTISAGDAREKATLKKTPPIVLGAQPVGLKAIAVDAFVVATMDGHLYSYERGTHTCLYRPNLGKTDFNVSLNLVFKNSWFAKVEIESFSKLVPLLPVVLFFEYVHMFWC